MQHPSRAYYYLTGLILSILAKFIIIIILSQILDVLTTTINQKFNQIEFYLLCETHCG